METLKEQLNQEWFLTQGINDDHGKARILEQMLRSAFDRMITRDQIAQTWAKMRKEEEQ